MKLIKKNYTFSSFEPIIIIAFWALLFASPLLFGRFEDSIEWDHIFNVWLNFLPLVVLFLVNRFVLLPTLFFKNKRPLYFILASLLIIFLSITVNVTKEKDKPNFPPQRAQQTRKDLPPPGHLERDLPRPPDFKHGNRNPKPIPVYANFLILAVLLVGFDTGLQISMRWSNLEQEKFKLQKENVENQLAFLRNQVSPHFFMNTLNNIHALVDIDSEEAKESIVKLSNLMRHLLYDSEERETPIKKEIEFIQSYIELMRLRFTDKVSIAVEIPNKIPDKTIPPLLFTSLLENAFKHGISYKNTSFIKIQMSFTEDHLNFNIENSNHSKATEDSSGIGVENTKKRLNLLYKNLYDLTISDTKEKFAVNLNIPL